jgi:hypothetical protein
MRQPPQSPTLFLLARHLFIHPRLFFHSHRAEELTPLLRRVAHPRRREPSAPTIDRAGLSPGHAASAPAEPSSDVAHFSRLPPPLATATATSMLRRQSRAGATIWSPRPPVDTPAACPFSKTRRSHSRDLRQVRCRPPRPTPTNGTSPSRHSSNSPAEPLAASIVTPPSSKLTLSFTAMWPYHFVRRVTGGGSSGRLILASGHADHGMEILMGLQSN